MRIAACTCLLLLLALLAGAAAQFDFGGGGKKELPPAVKSDVPFIKCGACQLYVKQALRTVKAMREELKPGKKLEEGDVIEKLEQLCDARRPEGEWLRTVDMVEDGDAIALKDMGKVGKHTVETSTIARACAEVSDALDLSDLSEALYLGKPRSALAQLACYDMSGACRAKPPPVPEDRPAGPEFAALSEAELERERLMAKLAASGMGGQMFDRESLKEQMDAMQGAADGGAFDTVRLSEAGGAGGAAGLAGRLQEGAAGVAAAAKDAAAKASDAVAGAAAKAGEALKGVLGKLGGGGGGAGSKSEL